MDKINKEQRSKTMKAIKSKNTKIENLVSKELHKQGFRFRRNSSKLIGKPDISIKKYKMVIFIDSCFWHGCEKHFRMPKSNVNYWNDKIARNKARDEKINEYYKNQGWNILRIWEHQFKSDFSTTIQKIVFFIEKIRDSELQK